MLGDYPTDWCETLDKPLVLLLDEVVSEMFNSNYSREITPALIDLAKERLIDQRQTYLDSLADKIDDSQIWLTIMSIITGDSPAFDWADDAIRNCRDLGIISTGNPIQFANPMYREIITRILTICFSVGNNQNIAQTSWYLNTDSSLNIDKLLDAFTDFYRWNSESWIDRYKYQEAGHQLFLMAFLQRVINGGGRIEREMAAGNGRTDLVIFWKEQVITIEIKMHHDKWSEPEGIEQLARYLNRLGQKTGYMVFLEKKSAVELSWEDRIRHEVHIVNNKEIIIYAM